METRYSTCLFCDGGCTLKAEVKESGSFTLHPLNPASPAICSKAGTIDEYRFHPDRVTRPLKNVGERGEPQWEAVSWDEALDEIAVRLRGVIDAYGPEAVAFAETPLNHGFGGVTRRLMNCIGSPNYTAPVQLCMGNTAQVHRAVYGWFTSPRWDIADCIVYFGQDRDEERWPAEYQALNAALERGAKLIVIDPRRSRTSARAHWHLPIRYGTDAALALSWINVIIEEGLFDRAFVEERCLGFAELRERASAYKPEIVADICGIDANLIRKTARVYASADAAIIPWGIVGDMQVNSTSLLQAQCILRAICGFINVSENVFGPALGGVGNAQLADFVLPGDMWAERDALRPAYDVAPLFSAAQALCDPVGECKSWYCVIKGLADRLGYADDFPWTTEDELYDFRLRELGITWAELRDQAPKPVFRQKPAAGQFVTASGKAELRSSVLETLGFDPLPRYQEPLDPGADDHPGAYPYLLFAGLRERKSYNTCLHQIESLRRQESKPLALVNPSDAAAEGITEGLWCEVETAYGSISLMAHLDDAQPEGTLRVPHGWWKPETPGGVAAGLSCARIHNDGMLFPDADWNLDGPQGVPNLRGGIHASIRPL